MRWQRAARIFGSVVAGIAALQGAYVIGCVDGTTPDCSDAATHCGPDIDAADASEASLVPDAAPQSDAATDAGRDGDADLDANLDADSDAADGH